MVDQKYEGSVDSLFGQLNQKANIVYWFAILYNDYMSSKQSYGTDMFVNMVEVHMLTSIEENQGITITELAKYWKRTKSAVSQTVTKLEKKGLVERVKNPNNEKSVFLYPTKKGTELSISHKNHDAVEVADTMRELMKTCTPTEIDSFFKVIKCYIDLLMEE